MKIFETDESLVFTDTVGNELFLDFKKNRIDIYGNLELDANDEIDVKLKNILTSIYNYYLQQKGINKNIVLLDKKSNKIKLKNDKIIYNLNLSFDSKTYVDISYLIEIKN